MPKKEMSSNNAEAEKESILSEITPHLEELRKRLIISFTATLVFAALAFYFSGYITIFLTGFFLTGKNITLHFFDISEPFTFKLKISFLCALYTSVPVYLFHLIRFVSPALSSKERKKLIPVTIAAVILFYTGSVLAFKFALPQTIDIMLGFAPSNMTNSINAGNFLSFVFCFIFFGGIIFEMPVLTYLLSKFGIIKKRTLYRKRKFALVAIWIIAAVITPPDVLSQVMAAIPMMLLYELSAFTAFITADS